MGSSGKKKTTMAKLARENRLRERRASKQARKDARKQESADRLNAPGADASAGDPGEPVAADLAVPTGEIPRPDRDDAGDFDQPGAEPVDPRSKEVTLERLRGASDEELAVFEGTLRGDAVDAGATEQEIRQAQQAHPEHGA